MMFMRCTSIRKLKCGRKRLHSVRIYYKNFSIVGFCSREKER